MTRPRSQRLLIRSRVERTKRRSPLPRLHVAGDAGRQEHPQPAGQLDPKVRAWGDHDNCATPRSWTGGGVRRGRWEVYPVSVLAKDPVHGQDLRIFFDAGPTSRPSQLCSRLGRVWLDGSMFQRAGIDDAGGDGSERGQPTIDLFEMGHRVGDHLEDEAIGSGDVVS